MSTYRIKWTRWGKRARVIWWLWRRLPTVYIPRVRRENEQWRARTLAHEIVHVEQWKRLGRWGFVRSYLSKRGRLALEGEAFAASCNWWWELGHQNVDSGGRLIPVLAYYTQALETKYRLGLGTVRCRAAIEKHL